MQMLLKFQPCPQSAKEVYLASDFTKILFFLTIVGLLADLDLQDLEALVTDPAPALNFLIRLQTVKMTLNYYHK